MATEQAVIVGAGVVGCAIARELATDHDVLVVDWNGIASGTTGRSAGKVTMTPAYSDVPAIAAHANAFFEARDGFSARESIELVPPDREGEARRRAARLTDEGLDVSFLDAKGVETAYSCLDLGAFCGAVRHERTGFVDATALTESLAAEAKDRGARFRTDTTVTDLRVEDGGVAGVETEATDHAAATVVVAAGWRTPDLLEHHLKIPVRPYRTQCAVYRPGRPLPAAFPMGAVPEERVYFRPLERDLLVGGWAHAVDSPEAASRESDPAFREHVREVVPSFLADDEGKIRDHWAGIDCGTPDTRPIIDAPETGPERLAVATGFHGRGVMTAPVAATAVRALLTDETPPFPLAPFRLDRFEDRSRDFEFFSIGSQS